MAGSGNRGFRPGHGLYLSFISRFGPRALEVGFLNAMNDLFKTSWLQMIERSREDVDDDECREMGIRREWLDILSELAKDVDFRHIRASDERVEQPIASAIWRLMNRDYWHPIRVISSLGF